MMTVLLRSAASLVQIDVLPNVAVVVLSWEPPLDVGS